MAYDKEIYDKIVGLICDEFDMKPEELKEDTTFLEDLCIDSVDVVEMLVEVENQFGLEEISEEDMRTFRTIGDLAAYVTAHSA